MTLDEYMTEVRDHYWHGTPLPPAYTPDDKDMGYRCGLAYLGLQMTPETDAIAQDIIYPMMRKVERLVVQLDMFDALNALDGAN